MDGRTDMTKLIVAFRNFANAPERGLFRISKNLEAGDLANKKCVISHKTFSKKLLDRDT